MLLLISPKLVYSGSLSRPEILGDDLFKLGILYISSYLNKHGIKVKIKDYHAQNPSKKELFDLIKRYKPSHVGISMITHQVYYGIQIAKMIKEVNKKIIIIGGGPHISATKDELFKFSDCFDYLVYGEGEETVYEIIKEVNKKKIEGLIYKHNDKVYINPPRKFIENLDKLPFPDMTQINIEYYDLVPYLFDSSIQSNVSNRYIYMITSRGCLFNCSFCGACLTHGKKIRRRTPKNVVDEIELNQKKIRINHVKIVDPVFTIDKKFTYEFCNELEKRNIKIKWSCNTRVDSIDKALIKKMKNSGCFKIRFGIESGSKRVLKNVNKGISLDQIKKAVNLCKQFKIKVGVYIMFGNPGETPKEAHDTINLIKTFGKVHPICHRTTALPNTPLFNLAIKEGYLDIKRYYKLYSGEKPEDCMSLNLPDFPVSKQKYFCDKVEKIMYLTPSRIISSLKNINSINDFKNKCLLFCRLLLS